MICCSKATSVPHQSSSDSSDLFRFFRSWLSTPLRVAAIAPSSRALASIMTQELSEDHGSILELGPGTGVFTRALLDRGIDESSLTLIEYGADFAGILQKRFPRAHVLRMDAAHILGNILLTTKPFEGAISGLPLLSMGASKIVAILSGAFSHMAEGAAFYQFTYGPRCPVPQKLLDHLELEATRIGGTLFNIPPAAVYKITRSHHNGGVETDFFEGALRDDPDNAALGRFHTSQQEGPGGTGWRARPCHGAASALPTTYGASCSGLFRVSRPHGRYTRLDRDRSAATKMNQQ